MTNPHLHLHPPLSSEKLRATRDGFGEALLELGQTNPAVVVLTADLAESTKVESFGQKYPDQFFDVGVAEQNMIGLGAGLAAVGFIPFCTSYAVFSPGRNWEQIRTSVGYSQTNVKIVSTHAGLSVGPDGATHQALEDIALSRVIPHLAVINPCDYEQAKRATHAIAEWQGPVYLRLSREPSHPITTLNTPFEIGKAQVLRYGTAVTFVATGIMVPEALRAAAEVDGEVINVHTIKPLDSDTILESVKKTGKLITVEEHQVAGGLGSAVLEALAEKNYFPRVKLMGVNDQFGQSGTASELLEAYGLTWNHLVNHAKKLIQ